MKYSEKAAVVLAIVLAVGVIVTLASIYQTHNGSKAFKMKNVDVVEKNVPRDTIQRCVDLCKDASKVVKLSRGRCISPDLNGFGCAVIENNNGHCVRFYRGTPEIVLDENCVYVGVIQWKG